MEVITEDRQTKRKEIVRANDGTEREEEDEWKERKRRSNMRRVGAYLTDNVVIVRQVVSVSLGSRRRGVTQFPYVWLRAVGCGGN